MISSVLYLRQHGATLRAFARLLTTTSRGRASGSAAAAVDLPSEPQCCTVQPLPDSLIDDFVRFCGGDPAWYAGHVPPLLYPQWGLGLAARNLARLPYAFRNIVNVGTSVLINTPLPRHEPLKVIARLVSIEEDERLITFEQEIVTDTAACPAALVARFSAALRKHGAARSRHAKRASDHAGEEEASGVQRQRNMVPEDAEAWAAHAFSKHAGGQFALLTGDVNPVHWLPPYARMLGFSRPILHGFATAAFAFESVVRRLCDGDPAAARSFEVRFTRPLVLPAEVRTFIEAGGTARGGGEIFVGRQAGGPAVAVGRVQVRGAPGRRV